MSTEREREQLSALVDGALGDDAQRALLARIEEQPALRARWGRYHVIGVKDFAPVSLVANFQMALAVGPGAPVTSLREYIEWARADPRKATYGVPLAGGPTHFFGVMLARATGINLTAFPYKGSAPFVNDLLGGHVPAGITVLSQLIKHHEAGKVRLLATSGSQRSPLAPAPLAPHEGRGPRRACSDCSR